MRPAIQDHLAQEFKASVGVSILRSGTNGGLPYFDCLIAWKDNSLPGLYRARDYLTQRGIMWETVYIKNSEVGECFALKWREFASLEVAA